MKRIFLIVLDSVGIGAEPDAAEYGDEGSNTLAAAASSAYFSMPNMQKLGLFNIDGVDCRPAVPSPKGSFGRLQESSRGKDTTIGHWEIAGLISKNPLPTYPQGFPREVLDAFSKATKRSVLCNRPYSGTKVIEDYGKQHMDTGALIVYTSADSVFQIAAHEEVVPVEQLYEYCHMARKLLKGKHGVGRVIARPFLGQPGSFVRTSNRHDFSLEPPGNTMCDYLMAAGKETIGIGKISDIFAGKGIRTCIRTKNNQEGIARTIECLDKDFEGLCFVNLVDYDMLYGHRNDVDGYAKALTAFDQQLPDILSRMGEEDLLLITADHGCDPATPSTDHSREYTPLVLYGKPIASGVNLGTRATFADIAATVLDYFHVQGALSGQSLLPLLVPIDGAKDWSAGFEA